jgi:hypothetical protein
MRFAIILLAALPLLGQTPIKCPVDSWVGIGAGYNPTGSPKATGWASYAKCSIQSQGIYAYYTEDAIPVKGKVPTLSNRAGAGIVMRSFGPNIFLVALATAGVAQTSTATTGAFSGGGLLFLRFHTDWTVQAGARIVSAGGVNSPIYELGLGRSF